MFLATYLPHEDAPLGEDVDTVPMIVSVSSNAWGFFIHTNVRWRLGWFEWVISSPAFHHWHHTNDSAAVLNNQYGCPLTSDTEGEPVKTAGV